VRTIALALALATSLFAQEVKQIDPAKSRINIYAYRSGVFAFAGHNHLIEAPISSGSIDEGRKAVEVTVDTSAMQVLSPDESPKNRVEVRKTMLSDQLLDAEKYPTISFRSTSFKQLTPASAEVRGELSLHGTVRTVTVTVKKVGEVYTGSTRLKQTDYGMKPVSVAGGTIKVKDEVKIEFSVATN
jgi:polyisoprenoid-binding protein YceI